MNNKEKWSMDNFMGTWEKMSDNFVSMFYSEWLVKSIEWLEFMKSLVKSSFIEALQSFWKGWFKQVFVFFWYLAIIFWLISIVKDVLDLLNTLWYMRGMISVILSIVSSCLMVITWFWIIKFKKWYPFMAIVSYIVQMVVYLTFPMMYGYWVGFSYYYSSSSIWSIVVSLWFFIVWLALIFKNKELFKN